jgi:hypothetical protein
MTTTFTVRSLVTGFLLFGVCGLIGCGETWDYHALRGVQTNLPRLMDSQWSRKRDYTEAEMLAVRSGGTQTILVGRVTKPPVYNDVAQLDEAVSRTYVLVLDEMQVGKTYHITPDNGRVIEGTSFRPAWRPYRGLEGDVTILSVSKDTISAAVRVSSLSLKTTDPERSMNGVHSFKTATGTEPGLVKAQINVK